jgi:hypothetical protein
MSNKILAFSNYDENFAVINDITYPHNKKYFDKHNIEYSVFNNNIDIINTLTPHVTKCYYIKWILLQKLLETRNDINYFFAIDTDIIICDFNIDLRIFTKLSSKDILLCSVEDCSPDMFWNVNAGSMIVKNNDRVKSFISSYLDFAKSHDYNIIDQPLLQNFIYKKPEYRFLFSIFPSCAFNHGGLNSFLYHDCNISTSNKPLKECIEKKSYNLKTAIDNLNNYNK